MRDPELRTLAMAVLAVTIGTPSAVDAQTFNTALPVATGRFIFREQFLYRKASDDPTPANRELDVLGGIAVLGYGATSDLTLFGMLPWFDKELDATMLGGQRISRGSSGVGDAQLFARYTVVQKDRRGRSFRVAPFLGIKLPTGDDDESDALGQLPQPLQPGSGSWDPFGGVIATWQTLDYQIDAQLGYRATTRANGFEFGDEFQADASFQYRLWPRELSGGVPGFLYSFLETNLLHQAKNEIGGSDDSDSGGTRLFLSPGIKYVTRRWVFDVIVQLPVVQDLGGNALEDDFRVRTGVRVNL